MHEFRDRIHIRHYERAGAAVHIVWRLKESQPILNAAERAIVLEVIRRGIAFGCTHHAGVVMDDHVHALFTPGPARSSTQLVSSWKSHSSRLICREHGRRAPLWQRDFFQRWIRTPAHLTACATYIRANPARRWPGIETYPWIL